MTTSQGTTLRIFISHSHKDNEFGVKLVEDLRRVIGDESAVWYDAKGGLHGGDTWWPKIIEEITARNIFIVVLSPDAISSPWVNDEITLAWQQKNSPAGKRIFPILYRQCKSRGDLDTLHNIYFLPPRTYEDAFNELLIALGLSPYVGTSKPTRIANDPDAVFVRQIAPQIEASFAASDWPDVIRKTNFLLKRAPVAVTSEIYRMQGVAFFEDAQMQQAQEAFEAALALISDREQRLTIMRNYTDLLASQERWSEVPRLANEALRLVPNDQSWMTMQQQAMSKVQRVAPSAPQKTKEQWINEGNAAYNAGPEQYEEAIAAYDHVITLDSKNAWAYARRGNVYRALKDSTRAIQDFDRAIELNSSYSWAYVRRGEAHRMLNDYHRAIQDFNRAIELNPKYAWAYGNRGRAYSSLKLYQQAIQDFDRALELGSTLDWVKTDREEAHRLLKQQR